MLILASITLTLVLGDDGLLARAKDATELYKQAEENDKIQLNNLYSELASVTSSGINTEELSSLIKQIVQEERLNQYPIGSVYISFENTDPTDFIGGKWKSCGQGRTLIGAGTGTDSSSESKTFAVNEEGGEYNHTLTIDEMPSHSHTRGTMEITGYFTSCSSSTTSWALIRQGGSGAFDTTVYSYTSAASGQGGFTAESVKSGSYSQTIFTASNSWTGETSFVGENGNHNNIQPYTTVYMWKRVE